MCICVCSFYSIVLESELTDLAPTSSAPLSKLLDLDSRHVFVDYRLQDFAKLQNGDLFVEVVLRLNHSVGCASILERLAGRRVSALVVRSTTTAFVEDRSGLSCRFLRSIRQSPRYPAAYRG